MMDEKHKLDIIYGVKSIQPDAVCQIVVETGPPPTILDRAIAPLWTLWDFLGFCFDMWPIILIMVLVGLAGGKFNGQAFTNGTVMGTVMSRPYR